MNNRQWIALYFFEALLGVCSTIVLQPLLRAKSVTSLHELLLLLKPTRADSLFSHNQLSLPFYRGNF